MDTHTRSQSVAFFHLLGNDLRWQLVRALAHSDMRLSELATRTGVPPATIVFELAALHLAHVKCARRWLAPPRSSTGASLIPRRLRSPASVTAPSSRSRRS